MARYFITGGGTGGHIYPAIAVADALLEDTNKQINQPETTLQLFNPSTKDEPCSSDTEIFYVGNPKNLEYDIVNQKGYKFLPVNVHGMPRKFGFELLKWLFQLDLAVFKACYYILKYKPDAVFGTGGYVSAPALIAAKMLNIPFMMHDCDAQPGLVSRKLAPYAKCVSVAFESAKEIIKNRNCYINGNPIRSAFKTLSKDEARRGLNLEDKLTICIMGGSQGAKSINDAVVPILEKMSKELDLQIIFQTGKKNYERVLEQLIKYYPEYASDSNLLIRPYFDDMVSVLKASDIAISRSGSLSIFEICASKVAPIYVPYPYAAADHQRKNAKYMVEKGAGLYLDDNDITNKTLYEKILSLVNDKEKLSFIQNSAFSLAHLDGTEKIVEQFKSINEKD